MPPMSSPGRHTNSRLQDSCRHSFPLWCGGETRGRCLGLTRNLGGGVAVRSRAPARAAHRGGATARGRGAKLNFQQGV